jgi:uncharacterized protein
MTMNPALTLGSFLVGGMVGLTGMGGGALLTPMLMLGFGVPPLAAVSSDLVVSAITKPFGVLVHLRRGTVNLRLAGWLSVGSVPSAFFGGLAGWWLGSGTSVQTITQRATGAVLVVAAVGIVAKSFLIPSRRDAGAGQDGASPARRGHAAPAGRDNGQGGASTAGRNNAAPAGRDNGRGGDGGRLSVHRASARIFVRPIPTLLIGIVVGLVVGVTSTGSGTLVIAALAMLYPALPTARLVGTDLAQAVPMVVAAAIGHAIAGDIQMSVTAPLLIGGIPGVVAGSLLSSRARGSVLRPVLSIVILGSGLSLLGLGPAELVVTLVAAVAAGGGVILLLRRRRVRRADVADLGDLQAAELD